MSRINADFPFRTRDKCRALLQTTYVNQLSIFSNEFIIIEKY